MCAKLLKTEAVILSTRNAAYYAGTRNKAGQPVVYLNFVFDKQRSLEEMRDIVFGAQVAMDAGNPFSRTRAKVL